MKAACSLQIPMRAFLSGHLQSLFCQHRTWLVPGNLRARAQVFWGQTQVNAIVLHLAKTLNNRKNNAASWEREVEQRHIELYRGSWGEHLQGLDWEKEPEWSHTGGDQGGTREAERTSQNEVTQVQTKGIQEKMGLHTGLDLAFAVLILMHWDETNSRIKMTLVR